MASNRSVGLHVGLVIGALTIIGVGLGVTGYLTMGMVQDAFTTDGQTSGFAQAFVALAFLQSAITVFFIGPVAGGLAGFASSIRHSDAERGTLVGGLGSFIGFYPMIVLAIYIMALAFDGGASTGDGGGGGFDILGNITTILVAGVPTGLVGAATGYLGTRF